MGEKNVWKMCNYQTELEYEFILDKKSYLPSPPHTTAFYIGPDNLQR